MGLSPPNRFPLVLIILDGWGEGPAGAGNAIRNCRPEAMATLAATYPSTFIEASGTAVGLPEGQMGNSEAGHLCIGAGRTVHQDLSRINESIRKGEFARKRVLQETLKDCAASGGFLHLIGLVSDGGVHSHIDHLKAILRLAADSGLRGVRVHAFTDGRDTPPKSAANHLRELNQFLSESEAGTIVTVSGRYYAMDRDRRWERTEPAYHTMTSPSAEHFPTAEEYAESNYREGITDEFLPPVAIGEAEAVERTRIRDGDTVIFFNFRADRARQITRALTEGSFQEFRRKTIPRLARFVCFTEYDQTYCLPIVYPQVHPSEIFAELISRRGWRQLRIAETEKYAHVTFFFNGGIEKPFPGEERILVPSPRIRTYDLQPEMSGGGITEEVIRRLGSADSDVLIVNFANADMVGHTGKYEPTAKACKFLDGCVDRIVRQVLARKGTACITADHGNAEQMFDPGTDHPHTAHTTNPVPVILAGEATRRRRLRSGGSLGDLIPTLLEILEIDPPAAMTGKSLLT